MPASMPATPNVNGSTAEWYQRSTFCEGRNGAATPFSTVLKAGMIPRRRCFSSAFNCSSLEPFEDDVPSCAGSAGFCPFGGSPACGVAAGVGCCPAAVRKEDEYDGGSGAS